MSAGVVGSLVRRGAEATLFSDDKTRQQVPGWAMAVFVVTIVIYSFVSVMIDYTFGRIIPTLIMVQSPEENIDFEPLPTGDTDDTLNKNLNPELQATRPKPVTASFRSTLRLLSQKGGFRGCFRGIFIYIVTQILLFLATQLFSIAPLVPRPAASLVAAVLCAQLSLAWTHIVISEPSPKTWLRRLPPMKTWKRVALPTAILALAEQVTIFVPFYIGMACNMGKHLRTPEDAANMSGSEARILILKALGLGALAFVLGFLLVIPAQVVLTRVQASLLSDDEETIVPFDRSFNGKVVPEIVGGSGVIGILDAWKTFEWASRIRLVKAYFKVFLMHLAVGVLFQAVVVGEVALFLSKSKKVDGEPGGAELK